MESIPDHVGSGVRTLRPARLKDVAERAGVSVSTVARVLHDNGYVSGPTREAVDAALAECGYQINTVAQRLRKQRSAEIGHILDSISPNPFFAGVALGSERAAAEYGCTVLFSNTHGDADLERTGVEALLQRRVEAILFTTVTDERNVDLALSAGATVVQVERVSDVATHAVTVDNYRGAFDATEHLLRLGHRRVACLGVDPDLRAAPGTAPHRRVVERERLSGYFDALRTFGVAGDDELVTLGPTYYDVPAARAAVRRWLQLPAARRPTAIFATCDIMAAGILQEAHVNQLRVPDDLSLVGFDDTYAGHLTPPLTTVRQPMEELGRVAVRLAMTSRDGAVSTPQRERLTTQLIVRESTAPPAW
ncbi:MAG: LacI family DNA-binding transcriptional regulator [Thermomicrobiales bacterium]